MGTIDEEKRRLRGEVLQTQYDALCALRLMRRAQDELQSCEHAEADTWRELAQVKEERDTLRIELNTVTEARDFARRELATLRAKVANARRK